MKSGMRSIGDSAYAATHAATIRAASGVRGSLAASQMAMTSRLIARAHCLARSSVTNAVASVLPVRIFQAHFAVAFGVVAPLFADFDEEEQVDGDFVHLHQ